MGDMRGVSQEEWKKRLTPEQYHILRQHGTEPPFTGELLANKETGEYKCAACGAVLFKSGDKFESHQVGLMSWPSFADVAGSDKVELIDDLDWGMKRTEVRCKNCGSHLGHLFQDEESPTGQHYCINSCALDFESK